MVKKIKRKIQEKDSVSKKKPNSNLHEDLFIYKASGIYDNFGWVKIQNLQHDSISSKDMDYRVIRGSERGHWDPDKLSSIGQLTPLKTKIPVRS